MKSTVKNKVKSPVKNLVTLNQQIDCDTSKSSSPKVV
ncbi:MAG: hypothetical protein ACJAUM_002710, partial [Pseudomonadales bacterium]